MTVIIRDQWHQQPMAWLGSKYLNVTRRLRVRLGGKASTLSEPWSYSQLDLFGSLYLHTALNADVDVGLQIRQPDMPELSISPSKTATHDDALENNFDAAGSDPSVLPSHDELDDNLIVLFEDDEEENMLNGEIVDALPGESIDDSVADLDDLTQMLEQHVLPRLQHAIEHRGYLTLGNLSAAVAKLQASQPHLEELRRFVQHAGVPLIPSRSHAGLHDVRVEHIRIAEYVFGDLVQGTPDRNMVIERLGYMGVPLSSGTRDFLMHVWMAHRLARVEERIHFATVAREMALRGSDVTKWSNEALATRELLVMDNLWLVARIARKYIGKGVEIEDLLQEGASGLFDAVERFDPSLGFRFVTYASNWVFQRITRALANQARTVRLPVHMIDWLNKVDRTTENLECTLGREPTVEELVEELDVERSVVIQALSVRQPIMSINILTNEQWTKLDLDQFRQDPNPVFEDVVSRLAGDEVRWLLSNLTSRERRILELRFGLEDRNPLSLEEVGQIYGLTRERIRQIQARAIGKLQRINRERSRGEQSNTNSPDLLGVRNEGAISPPKDALFAEHDSPRRPRHGIDARTEQPNKANGRKANSHFSKRGVTPILVEPRATTNLASKIPNDSATNFDAEFSRESDLSVALGFVLRMAFPKLSEEDQALVMARFGLMRPRPMTLTEVVTRFAVTAEYVIDLQSRLVDEIGHPRLRDKLMAYLETVDRCASAH